MTAYEVEKAKREIRNKIYELRIRYGITASVMEGTISSILIEIKEDAIDEVMRGCDIEIQEINEELKKAKAAAKKVLKAEPEQVSESDTGRRASIRRNRKRERREEVKRNGNTGKTDDTNQY